MIKFENVCVKYNGRFQALDNVNLKINAGEFVCIVGASGAGKSTLIKLLLKEENPYQGRIIVANLDYAKIDNKNIPYLRRRIGVVFQDFKLLPNLNVFENVAFALEVSAVSTEDIKRTVPKILNLVGLSEKEKHYPNQLSGGERQRVAIARALIRTPKILVADEPTGNLDPKTAWGITELLLRINKLGTTVILTTHNYEIVKAIKKRVITIGEGKIVSDKPLAKSKAKDNHV
jgi:cell division transport system ATP-binding protein